MSAAAAQRAKVAALGAGLLAACLLLGASIRLFASDAPLAVDSVWHDAMREVRHPVLEAASLGLNEAGATVYLSFVAPVAIAIVLCLWGRWRAAAVIAIGAATCAPTVSLLKAGFDIERPRDMAFALSSAAYPSGHLANLVVLLVIVALVVRRPWCWAVAATLAAAMAASRTYLGVHWLSDTIGGALLGAGIALLAWAVVPRASERTSVGRSERTSWRTSRRTSWRRSEHTH